MASSTSVSSTAYLHAAVAFSKMAGTLAAHHNQTLTWTPSIASTSVTPFAIKFVDIAGLQTSKAGAAQTALMIALANGAQVAAKSKVLLVFNAAQQTALEDREKFKVDLATAVARNRAQQQGQQLASGSSTPLAPGSPAQASMPSSSAAAATRGATPDVTSSSAKPLSSLSPAQAQAQQQQQQQQQQPSKRSAAENRPPPKTEMELRISVLRSNPHLRSLHKDVVLSGAMQDSEFWSHPQRQALIRAERAMLEQRQGRNARLADPKPTPNEAGELKLSITVELIRDLFEQFPIVARAYEENVPSKLDESAFWTRYFQSKLYHRLRTSARSAANEHIVQDDPVFDRYLEDEDDQLESRRLHHPHDRLLDLASIEEDHQETGNTKDWTMRAGAERKTLPLMRRFNDHSQSLLDSALGEQEEAERRSRRVVGGVGEEYDPNAIGTTPREDAETVKARYYREIEIDDLNESDKTERVKLNVGEVEGYLQSQTHDRSNGGEPLDEGKDDEALRRKRKRQPDDDGSVPKTMEEVRQTVARFDEGIKGWTPRLGEYRPGKGESEVAMKVMLTNVRARTTGRGVNDLKTLPDPLQKSTVSVQASTTEFLRQLWSCLSPSSSSSSSALKPSNWKDLQASALSSSSDDADTDREKEDGERRERAAKMMQSLEKALEKIKSVEREAEEEYGEDARRKIGVPASKQLKAELVFVHSIPRGQNGAVLARMLTEKGAANAAMAIAAPSKGFLNTVLAVTTQAAAEDARHDGAADGSPKKAGRDSKRRAAHSLIERRRREKIPAR